MTATQACSSAICLLSLALAATTPAAGSSDKAPRLTGEASGDAFAATEHGPHLTDEQRRFIENEIVRNVTRLRAEGRMPAQIEAVVPLGWPFAPWNGLAGFGHHGVSNFVDQNPDYPGAVLDYQCGGRTYDLSSGYNPGERTSSPGPLAG